MISPPMRWTLGLGLGPETGRDAPSHAIDGHMLGNGIAEGDHTAPKMVHRVRL